MKYTMIKNTLLALAAGVMLGLGRVDGNPAAFPVDIAPTQAQMFRRAAQPADPRQDK